MAGYLRELQGEANSISQAIGMVRADRFIAAYSETVCEAVGMLKPIMGLPASSADTDSDTAGYLLRVNTIPTAYSESETETDATLERYAGLSGSSETVSDTTGTLRRLVTLPAAYAATVCETVGTMKPIMTISAQAYTKTSAAGTVTAHHTLTGFALSVSSAASSLSELEHDGISGDYREALSTAAKYAVYHAELSPAAETAEDISAMKIYGVLQ